MSEAAARNKSMRIRGARSGLRATVEVPGDKSISHRAAIFGAIAEGPTHISNFLPANDCLATLHVLRGLGVEIERKSSEVTVCGRGLDGLREPEGLLDCGGSGTTMRLMAGLLAGRPFHSVLGGNAQLSRRPMDRVVVPLREMGASIMGRDGGRFAPLAIDGGRLQGITYRLPVASAQVKSAILLAGLSASGATTVYEPLPTRDHTERMLRAMGASLQVRDGWVSIEPGRLEAIDLRVPGDISSAAFVLAAAALVPGSSVFVPGVGLNPGRTGILGALERMGATVSRHDERLESGEPVAGLQVDHSPLSAISVCPEEVPGMIDELPLLAVLATQARGRTEVRGAAELRVKETDRVATTVAELARMGAAIEALPDGFLVQGPARLRGTTVSSHGDHRLAMALAVAALVAEGETVIEDVACIDDSFPGFQQALATLLGEPIVEASGE